MTHPSAEELSRAVTEDPTTQMVDHMAACAACTAEWEEGRRLRALARSLPAGLPSRARLEAVRARVVAEASSARRNRARLATVGALALAASVALGVGLSRHGQSPSERRAAVAYHGTVTPAPGARFSRPSGVPDEVVVLESGTIHVEVSPLGRGERFRVRAGDGEVEVRGTAFDVAVEDGHLATVQVQHGRVDVRGASTPAVMLGAGESWMAVPPAAPPTSNLAIEEAPAPSAEPRAPAPSRPSAGHSATPAPKDEPPAPATAEPAPVPTLSPPLPGAPAPSTSQSRSDAVPVAPRAETPPAVGSTAVPAASGASERDERRRERREERRERHDERRVR